MPLPTYDQLELQYKNNPQQYQAFMDSAKALETLFASRPLRQRLEGADKSISQTISEWSSPFGLVGMEPGAEYAGQIDFGLDTIQTSLDRPQENLQTVLMSRPQPNGSTCYTIIKNYILETQGQAAADAFDQHLTNVNNMLQLGLNLDEIHAEADRVLDPPPAVPQEAPQEEPQAVPQQEPQEEPQAVPQEQVQNNNIPAAPAEMKEIDTLTAAQLLATDNMAAFMAQVDEAFGKMQDPEEKDPFYDLVSKARTVMGIGENIMTGGYQLPRDLEELTEYANNFLTELRKVKQETPEAFNKFFGGALEQSWNQLDFDAARNKLEGWGYKEPVNNGPENQAGGMPENDIIGQDILNQEAQEAQEELLQEEEPAGKKSWNGYIREHSGDKITDQNFAACFAKVAIAKQAMIKGEKFDLGKARERAEKLMEDPVFKKCMENAEEIKTMLKDRSTEDINRVIGNIGQPFAGTDKSMDTALEKLKTIGEAMDPSRKRSAEWKAMKQAFTNPPEHLTKAQKLQYAHDCIAKYMKGKKSLRSEGAERDRFDQSLDALAVLAEANPFAKARTSKLVDRINYVRTHRPMPWSKNQFTISDDNMAERAKNIDKFYNLRYASTSPAANQKAAGKANSIGITAADYLNMPAGKDTEKRLPVNDDVEFIWASELLVNICGDAKMQESKADFLATYLALEKVPAILNQHSQVSVDKAQLENAIKEVKESPDFNNFVESVSEQDLKDLKEGSNKDILNKIKQTHDNFRNPEAGMNI